MRFLLDTNAVSAFMGGSVNDARKRNAQTRMFAKADQYGIDAIGVSALTLFELQRGAWRMRDDVAARSEVLRKIAALPFTVLPLDFHVALDAGKIAGQFLAAGKGIGDADCLLGAHALREGLVMVTSNVQHMERIKGLRVVDWLK